MYLSITIKISKIRGFLVCSRYFRAVMMSFLQNVENYVCVIN